MSIPRTHLLRHTFARAASALICILVGSGTFAQTPGTVSPSAAATLPAQYQPQQGPERYNSNEPALILNSEEQARLRHTAPQWLQQALSFPAPGDLQKFIGKDPAAARERAATSIRQVLNPSFLPQGFQQYLIPMARWAVFYEDWRKHGGTDVFLTKFAQNGYVILLIESHNHVVVAARQIEGSRSKEFQGMLQLVRDVSDQLLAEPLKPSSPEGLKIFRTGLAPPHLYGYYTPRIDALAGEGATGELLTKGGVPDESSKSARATAVRFYTNGEFVAFMLLKPVKTTELRNPFEHRFEVLNLTQPDKVPFWEDQSLAGRTDLPDAEELRRRQIREYLGSFFYDQEGNALTDRIPVADLEREFRELTKEQRVDIARRKIIDENYAAGMKAFVAGQTTDALRAWTNILQYEPENARAAILLQLVTKQRAAASYGGNTEIARRAEPAVQGAMDAITRQQTLLSLRQQQEQIELVRERAIQDYRTRAIDFFSEGSYEESLREWENLLKEDPGNANALLFKEICQTKIKQQARMRPPVSGGAPPTTSTAPRR